MSFLSQVTKPQPKPPMITIIGSAGMGKTSLAALFPNPIFIQAEDGSSVFESWKDEYKPALLPPIPKSSNGKLRTKETLMAQLRELATAEHPYKTLVVDTITALNVMLEGELAARDDVGNVADASGGFHKGYIEVAQINSDFIYACEVLRRKGMAIVFLAHTGIDRVKNSPSENSEYSTYGIEMHKKSSGLFVSNSDAVLYIVKDDLVIGAETDKKGRTTKSGKVIVSDDRKIITSGDGMMGYVLAKSRYDMPNERDLPKGINPLLQYIPYFNK